MTDITNKFSNLEKLIGNTPLIEIKARYKNKDIKVYTKLEYYNYTGSIKDRIALYILKKAYLNKELCSSDIILEATSGNTGISFAALSTYLGNKIEIYMPDWMSDERKKLLKSFGAKLHLVSQKSGGFLKCISLTQERYLNEPNVFLPAQFSNKDNAKAHYLSTAPEIIKSLSSLNVTPDAFIAGVGTGGTIMGVGQLFKEVNPNSKIFPLEPLNSPTLSTGYKVNSHRIQGIVDEFIPPLLNLSKLDEVISVDDGDAILMAQKIASTFGLGVGISSGANFLGSIIAGMKLGKDSIITTIFPDDNKKYLSTDLMNLEPAKDTFLSPDIELIDFKYIE